MTDVSSKVRIRIFDIDPTTRGKGAERCIIYDAKDIGCEVFANDVGSAFWTLPVDHPAVPELVPLKRHYRVERYNGSTWTLIGAGLLSEYDATNDEIVYNGMDYMAMIDMHYTPLLGPEPGATDSIKRVTTGTTTVDTYNDTLIATRSASAFKDSTADPQLWNSNDSERHIPLGNVFSSLQILSWGSGYSTEAWVVVKGSAGSLLSNGMQIFISGASSSRLNGTRTIKSEDGVFPVYGYSDRWQVYFPSSGSVTADTVSSGSLYFVRYYSRGLVKFDLPTSVTAAPSGTSVTINSALMSVYQSNESGDHTFPDSNPGDLSVQRSTVDWLGDTSTGRENSWGNSSNNNCDWVTGVPDTAVGGTAVSVPITTNVANTKYEFSILSIANDWKGTAAAPGSANYGVRLKNTVENNVVGDGFTLFSTAASSSYRPKLVLNYTITTTSNSNLSATGIESGPTETKSYLRNRSGFSYARQSGKELAVYCRNNAGDVNKIDVTYSETDQTYLVSGVVYIERSAINDAEKLYDANKDNYIPNRFDVDTVKIALSASPGDEVCTFNVWPSSYADIVGTSQDPIELKWAITLRGNDSTVAEGITSAATAPTLTVTSGILKNDSFTQSYSFNCLVSGVSYSFSVLPVIALKVASAQTGTTYGTTGTIHELNGVSATTSASGSVMGLESKTLEGVFDKQIPPLVSAGSPYSRFGWLTKEVAPGNTWNTELLRYFTSGESVLSHLRAMCEKEMAANRLSARVNIIDGVTVPYRAVFNFVGMRGSSSPGEVLTIAPSASSSEPHFLLDYPGNVDRFRYKRDGKKYRNSVRVIPSTTFLTGTASSASGSKSKGIEKHIDPAEYGYAPLLVSQPNFADATELGKYADSLLERSSDILNVSYMQVTIGPDILRPFQDFYLGDIIRVTIRRTNVNATDVVNSDWISDSYIVGGVTIEVPANGAEKVTLDLVKASDFGR